MHNGKYIYIQEEDFKCPTFDAFDNFMMDIHPDLLFDHDLHNPNFFSSNQNNPINLSSTAHQNDSMPPNLLITTQNNTQSHLHHHHHNTNLSFGLMNDDCAAVNVVASSGTATASIFDDQSSLMPTPPPPPFDQPPPQRARGRGRPPKALPPGLPRPLRRSAAPPPPPPQLIPCQRRWTYTPHQGFPDEERKKYFRRDGMTHISDDQIKSLKGKKQLILGPQQQEQSLQLQAANLSSSSPSLSPSSSSKVVLMGREWGVMDAERLTNSSSMEEPGGPNSPILIDVDPEGLQSWKLHSN